MTSPIKMFERLYTEGQANRLIAKALFKVGVVPRSVGYRLGLAP